MKKNVLRKVFLVLLPAMAVMLATTQDSVAVYDIPAGTVETYSYFSILPVANLQMITPLAAMLAVVACALAVGYVVTGKQWCIQGVLYAACVSTCAAACPNLIRGDIMVMPNVVFPVLMAVLCFLAHMARKQPDEKPAAARLGN